MLLQQQIKLSRLLLVLTPLEDEPRCTWHRRLRRAADSEEENQALDASRSGPHPSAHLP